MAKQVTAKESEMAKHAVKPMREEVELFTDQQPAFLEPGTGAGLSTNPQDSVVPFVAVLHYSSPQVVERDPKYINGARPGMMWLRGATECPELVDGERGVIWQQCWYERMWIEWSPRDEGGGVMGRYQDKNGRPDLPGIRKSAANPNNWVNPETDNEIQLNKMHVGNVVTLSDENGCPVPPLLMMPYLIAFKSSGLFESSQWLMAQPKTRPDCPPANSWNYGWWVKTIRKSNAKGNWFDIHAQKRLGFWASEEINARGRELYEQFAGSRRGVEIDSAAPKIAAPAEEEVF